MVLASWYRIYTTVMDFLGVPTKMCWTVNRGKDLSPVESCEGELYFVLLPSCMHFVVASKNTSE